MEKKGSVLDRKISLLEALRDLLEEEKNCLINSDIEGLRVVSEKKEKVLSKLSALEGEGGSGASEPCSGLDALMLDIRLRAEENRRFINEMLEFIGGVIDVIAGKDHSPSLYGKGGREAGNTPLIYRAQV